MCLDDLALPLRIEQIGEALRRLILLHQIGVVGDDAEEDAEAGKGAVDVLVLRRIELGDIFRRVRRQHVLVLPVDQQRGVRRIDHVDGVHAGGIFLADALQQALGAAALDLARHAGIFGFERLADLLRQLEVDRGVPDDLALLLRCRDQVRGDHSRRRRRRQHTGREGGSGGERARADQHVTA